MITIRYGVGNSHQCDESRFPSIGHILIDQNLKALLGFGDNVVARQGGMEASPSDDVIPGSTIDLVAKAASKA